MCISHAIRTGESAREPSWRPLPRSRREPRRRASPPTSPTWAPAPSCRSPPPPTPQDADPSVFAPAGIAITPDGKTAWVTDNNGGSVQSINTATNTTGPSILDANPLSMIAIAPDGNSAYVTNENEQGTNAVTPLNLIGDSAGTPTTLPNATDVAVSPNTPPPTSPPAARSLRSRWPPTPPGRRFRFPAARSTSPSPRTAAPPTSPCHGRDPDHAGHRRGRRPHPRPQRGVPHRDLAGRHDRVRDQRQLHRRREGLRHADLAGHQHRRALDRRQLLRVRHRYHPGRPGRLRGRHLRQRRDPDRPEHRHARDADRHRHRALRRRDRPPAADRQPERGVAGRLRRRRHRRGVPDHPPLLGGATSPHLYVDGSSSASRVRIGIYADGAGRPSFLLGQATIATVSAGRWNYIQMPTHSLTAGQRSGWRSSRPGATARCASAMTPGGSPSAQTSASTRLLSLPVFWLGHAAADGNLSAYGN